MSKGRVGVRTSGISNIFSDGRTIERLIAAAFCVSMLGAGLPAVAAKGSGGGGGGGVDDTPPPVPAGTLATLQQRLLGDAAARTYGSSVALSGDTAVVAAPATAAGKGAVYVMQRTGALWKIAVKLTQPAGQTNAGFGASVAIAGDTVAIGNQSSASAASSVNVYQRTLGVWKHQARIAVAGSVCLGKSVAVNGSTIVAGDPCAPGVDAFGTAYAFVRTLVGTTPTWTRQAKFSPAGFGSMVGESVAISGNTAVISTSSDAAAAVYLRTGAVWKLQAKINPVGILLGYYGPGGAVAIDKDTLAIGIPTDSVMVPNRGLMAAAGATYLYHRSGTVWIQDARLTRQNDSRREHLFGRSVSISGNRVVVGMDEGFRGTGYATVFQRVNGVWNVNGNAVTLNPGGPLYRFGSSVALDGRTFIAGAPGEGPIPPGEFWERGAAYVYTLPVLP